MRIGFKQYLGNNGRKSVYFHFKAFEERSDFSKILALYKLIALRPLLLFVLGGPCILHRATSNSRSKTEFVKLYSWRASKFV